KRSSHAMKHSHVPLKLHPVVTFPLTSPVLLEGLGAPTSTPFPFTTLFRSTATAAPSCPPLRKISRRVIGPGLATLSRSRCARSSLRKTTSPDARFIATPISTETFRRRSSTVLAPSEWFQTATARRFKPCLC